jgi:hypothetical protein
LVDRFIGFPAMPRFAAAVVIFSVKHDPTAYTNEIVLVVDLVTLSGVGTINKHQ